MTGELLFVSSAITPLTNAQTKLVDKELRLAETKDAIYHNIATGYYDKLVLVDGTNNDIFNDTELDLIRRRGIDVEQLKFKQCAQQVNEFGKSYGEMLITNYMIENSNLVNSFGRFVKISGRYKLENADQIIPKLSKLDTFFLNYHPMIVRKYYPYTSTIMYKASIGFFKENLASCTEECSNDINGFLESVFFRRLHKLRRKPVKISYPFFSGLSGVTGKAVTHEHLKKRKILSALGFLGFTCDA